MMTMTMMVSTVQDIDDDSDHHGGKQDFGVDQANKDVKVRSDADVMITLCKARSRPRSHPRCTVSSRSGRIPEQFSFSSIFFDPQHDNYTWMFLHRYPGPKAPQL